MSSYVSWPPTQLMSAAFGAHCAVALGASALAACLFGTALADTPLARAGSNRGAGYSTRAIGYDGARGEFSLVATALIVLPILCAPLPTLLDSTPAAHVLALYALAACTSVLWYLLSPAVSHPGGPRAHRILREPQWPDKTWPAPTGWRCSIAEESHAHTHGALRNGQELTGEPAGRQIWHRVKPTAAEAKRDKSAALGFNPARNPNVDDGIWRAQRVAAWTQAGGAVPDGRWKPKSTLEHVKKALSWYEVLQADDGHWAGDYGGPHFLMPGLVVVWYVTGGLDSFLDADQRQAMAHYLRVHQQTDGGWGMHIESPSTMFGSCMCYIALRLLGAHADDEAMVRGRAFIRSHGGGTYTGSWAKFYMCLLGVMDWKGHNVIPPEMWLLPRWFAFHPGRLWCHCRMVYLPMCYLYGVKFVYARAETDPVIAQLRAELYDEPYESIRWEGTADHVADIDNYSPIHPVMVLGNAVLGLWEKYGGPLLRRVRAGGLAFAIDYMHAEDEQTNYVCIGPVNKVLNMLCAYHAAGGSTKTEAFQKHLLRVPDYLWVSEDGMKMQGYNGSQGWDASFTMQALAEAGLVDEFPQMCAKAYSYLERTQILCTAPSRESPAYAYETADMRQRYFRHVSEGGWPFSSAAHGWPISDCTAEGLKAVLVLRSHPCIKRDCAHISDERLFKALNVLLTLQNVDGGWATYENNRGYGWYEWLNPSEVFGDIMIDYSYVECSMASLSAVYAFHQAFPEHRTREVKKAIAAGRKFIKGIQRKDGSWYGSWGCCFTYGTWFGVEGLVLSGEPPSSPALKQACAFLLSKQNANGGWGEDFTSCYDKAYAERGMERYGHGGSGVVNTAWALLALMAAGSEDRPAIERGIAYLQQQQRPNGDWEQEGIAGVFNRACGISYTQYRNIFPIWALARYARIYEAGTQGNAAPASRSRRSPARSRSKQA